MSAAEIIGKDNWVEIGTEANELAAELRRSRLEAAGIPVRLLGSGLSSVYALTAGPLAAVRVLVPAEYVCLAREISAAPERAGE
ncbi:MAG: putative signal transducing protein [bacterium]